MWLRNFLVCLIFLVTACTTKPEFNLSIQTEEEGALVQEQYFDFSQVYKQITTHPEIDAYPAISPNGQWLAFSSRRSGNMDIWVKSVTGGSAFQISKHRSDDIMPAWSPDGKKLVFVSYREDAAGDLWSISLRNKYKELVAKGSPEKITTYLGTDVSPSFSRDGKYIAFTSDRNGELNIHAVKLRTKEVFQITKNGGIHPDWSRDGKRIAYVSFAENHERNGQIFYAELETEADVLQVRKVVPVTTGASNDAFPAWSTDGSEIVVTRYDSDTNNDGIVNPDDRPNLWKIILEKSGLRLNEDEPGTAEPIEQSRQNNADETQQVYQEIQLLPALHYDYQPVTSRDGKIYFISRRSGNEDIWFVPGDGPIPRQKEGFLQYQFASSYFPLPETDLIFSRNHNLETKEQLETRLIAFQRLNDFFPEEVTWVGWSLYEIARAYTAMNRPKLAKIYYEEIITQFLDNRELSGLSEIKLFELEYNTEDSAVDRHIQRLQNISEKYADLEKIAAQSAFLQGEVFYLSGRKSRALQTFKEMIEAYPNQTDLCAQAQILIGDIYSAFGQRDEVANAYLQIVQNYPGATNWTDLALEKVLALQKYDNSYSKVPGYRNILTRYKNYDRLSARAHLKIGEEFYNQGDYDAAIDELLIVENTYPQQREDVARSKLLISKVYRAKGEELLAISVYKELIDDFSDVQSGYYVVQAKEELLDLYLQSGDRYRMVGDMRAAYSRYRGAIQILPGYIDAHRGLVATMYTMGEINRAVEFYEKLCIENPDNENMLYILGLCYSYQATTKSDRTENTADFDIGLMKKSNEVIEEALSKNYRIIQAYLTLSFNYEAIEKYERYKRLRQSGFLKSLIKTTLAPVKSVYYWITFQKEKTPQRWFEEAIDVLITAIALNDENINPGLEGELALNLASNYYNLKEFGFERAYYYYHVKMQYDSTFTNLRSEAEIYKRMGHCALVVEDFKRGPKYLKKAIELNDELDDEQNKLLNIKRLALLYQLAGETRGSDDFDESVEYEKSVDYFKMAAEMDEEAKRYNMLEVGYRSIAYNYQVLNDEDEAIRYAEKALDLIRQGKVERVKSKPNWIKIGIMGVEFPVWNLGQIGTGASTAAEGFTTEEEVALLYSIIGNAKITKRSISGGISFLDKKLKIFQERKDKLAQAITLNNIGYLAYLDFDYRRAWENFKQSLTLCKQKKNTPGALVNIHNLGRLGVLISNLHTLPTQVKSDSVIQKLIERTPDYQAASLKYVHEGLKLIENETVGYTQEKIQLYNILGNIHFFESRVYKDSLLEDQYFTYRKQVEQLEGYAVADSCYRKALDLAVQDNSGRFQMTVRNNLGNLAITVGDINSGIEQFLSAREIAIEQNLSAYLWRIDFILGQILSVFGSNSTLIPVTNDASFYYNEAITTLERDAHQFHKIRLSPFYLSRVRKLYEHTINYEIESGRIISGLRLSEQFHGKQFLDIIGSHNLQLKKERHKIYLGNAKFLVEEIAALDKKIKLAEDRDEKSDPKYSQWIEKKRRYEKEYQELLVDLKNEDPELESFIHVEPVTFKHIQNILDNNSLVVDYFLSENKLHIWLIHSDSVSYTGIDVAKKDVQNYITMFTDGLHTQSHQMNGSAELYKLLVSPISNSVESSQNIIIVADGILRMIPFSYLINFSSENLSDLKYVTTVSGLANYYFSYDKRKIRGSKLFIASDKINETHEIPGYGNILFRSSASNNNIKKQFIDQVKGSDLVHFDAHLTRVDIDPLMADVGLEKQGLQFSFNLRDFYSLDLVASLIAIDDYEELGDLSSMSLERALMYAGAPTIIKSLWKTDDTKFWNCFYDALLDYPVAQALTKAQIKMRDQGAPPISWAGYQVVGYQGMTDEQERQFARESFMLTVNDASDDFQKESWGDAVKKFEKALKMAKKERNQEAINDLYDVIIQSAARGGDYEKAIQYQLELVEKAQANQAVQKLIEGYNNLFVFHTNSGNYEQAIYFQRKYLELAKQYDAHEEIAGSYYKLGLVNERSGNFEKALDYFTIALNAFRNLGDSLNVAQCYKDRGRIYLLRLDNYSKAIGNQELALNILKSENMNTGTIEILQNLGFSHDRLANYKTALKYQQEAFRLAKDSGDNKWIALSEHYLSNIYWKIGSFQQALNYQKSALEYFKELGETKLQVASLSTKGLILMSLGNLNGATEAELSALELAKSIADQQDMATIHKNLGLIYRSQEKWDSAKQQFEQAIQIDESISFRRGLSYDYRDLGTIYVQQGNFKEALNYFRKGLNLSKSIQDARNQVQCYYEIARAHFLSENIDAAKDTLTLASSLAEKLFIPDVEWRARRLIGRVFEEQNRIEQSIQSYTRALEIIETMRSQIKVEEFKSGFIDDKLVVYHELVDLYLKMDMPGKALEIVERAKSRNFVDLLANRDIKFSGDFDEAKFAQGKALEEDMRRIQNEISRLLIKGQNMTVAEKQILDDLEIQLAGMKTDYEEFLIELKSENPELAEMIHVEPLGSDSLQSVLPDSVLIIEYFYTENQMYIWAISKNRLVVEKQSISNQRLVERVNYFRSAMKNQQAVNSIARELYDLLIAPLENELSNHRYCVFVPHGVLHYLPFAALMDDNKHYLIENYALSLVPSSMVFLICLEKGQNFIDGKNWRTNILAFGNPDLKDARFELPFAEKEVESIELLYPDVTSFIGQNATETRFNEFCNEANAILLSCHGEFDAANPLFSSLLLSADDANDGFLQAHEIFGLEMDSYLIAMSACETGLASISVGDEVIGLSRSFIYAGASSLLSSLWKVDDLATAVMVKRFFRYLKQGHSRALALQLALNFVRTKINSHPVYWAAFNLTGDFR